jgi:hypothetical protein
VRSPSDDVVKKVIQMVLEGLVGLRKEKPYPDLNVKIATMGKLEQGGLKIGLR